MDNFIHHVLSIKAGCLQEDCIHFGQHMIRIYYTFGKEKFPIMYIDKTTGQIYSSSGKKPSGSVFDQHGGLEYIDDRCEVLINKKRKHERLEFYNSLNK